MSELGGEKSRGHNPSAPPPPPPPNYYYGTFQGVANYQPPPPLSQPAIGFPQPMPPPVFSGPSPQYYQHGYQIVPGYAVVTGRPFREERLPCCGIGIGWFLFISGFFLGAIPWYIGAFLLLCVRLDYREKGWSGCLRFSCNPSFHCCYPWCDEGDSFLVNFCSLCPD